MARKPPASPPEPPDAPTPAKRRGTKDSVDPIDVTNWRQKQTTRAHERNRLTYVAKIVGEFQHERRDSKGLAQRDVAQRLVLPDGTPHPITWRVAQREDQDSATTYSMWAKIIQRLESATQEPTFAGWLAWCAALDDDPVVSLQGLGLTAGGTSSEAALMFDPALDADGRQAMLLMYRRLTAGK